MEAGGTTLPNQSTDITDSLIGFTGYNQDVALFDYGNVIVRKDYKEVQHVRIISGGGAGNEPAYAGFVGRGMLTAAIQGNVSQSPNSKVILRTLRELSYDHDSGILIIVQGDSGTALNFGLAKEKALKEKLKVKILIVADDFNNNEYSKARKRGLTGVLLMIKLAAAMAESGLSLGEIVVECTKAQTCLCSISVALKSLKRATDQCVCRKASNESDIEIGKGLNQEPGIKKLKLSSSENAAGVIVMECLSIYKETCKAEESLPVVVMINNLNGLSKIEESIFVKEVLSAFKIVEVQIARLYVGNFFSSPTIAGLIFTILGIKDQKLIEYLDTPTGASAWIGVNQSTDLTLENIIPGRLSRRLDKYVPQARGPKLPGRQVNILRVALQFACEALVSCEKQINTIDSERGDGDTGTRLRTACELITRKIVEYKLILEYPASLFETLSRFFESSLGGTLGCIYSILFENASNYFGGLDEHEVITSKTWLDVLMSTSTTLKRYGVVELGENTMYDVFEMCAHTVKEKMEKKMDPMDAFGHGVFVAQETSQNKFPNCRYPDSGAHSVGIWMRAVYEAVKLTAPSP